MILKEILKSFPMKITEQKFFGGFESYSLKIVEKSKKNKFSAFFEGKIT